MTSVLLQYLFWQAEHKYQTWKYLQSQGKACFAWLGLTCAETEYAHYEIISCFISRVTYFR